MELNSFTQYIIENSYYKASDKEKFLPWYYELFGLNEELYELEEALTEKSFVLSEILSELGDVIFYTCRFGDCFGYDSSEFRNNIDQLEFNYREIKSNPLRKDEISIEKCLYSCRKAVGVLNGITKKSIRAGQTDLDLNYVNSCMYQLIYNCYIISLELGCSFNTLIDQIIEKIDRRNSIMKAKKESLELTKPEVTTKSVPESKKNRKRTEKTDLNLLPGLDDLSSIISND